MGTLIGRHQKQQKKSQKVSESSSIFDPAQRVPHKLQIRQAEPSFLKKKVELSFHDVPRSKLGAIEKSPAINELLHSDQWIIDQRMTEHHLRIVNALESVKESPALALHISMVQSDTKLICNPQGYLKERSLYHNSAIIYADLFRIRFSNLLKIKIKRQNSDISQAIFSLEPVAKLYAPFLEEFAADGHPITNARFLRKCHWPNLSKLSLRGNAIVDCRELGTAMAGLANSCHLQGIDLAGQHSDKWSEISWLLKMGYCDAETEGEMLQKDARYYSRYNGKVLQRVDCSIVNNKLVRGHLRMVQKKFKHNKFFDHPISIW